MSKVLRIGILAPPSISLVNGGVQTQVIQTAEALQRLGHKIIWIQSNEPFPLIDILHVFVASSEHWGLLRQLNSTPQLSGKDRTPIVLSPVFLHQSIFRQRSLNYKWSLLLEKFLRGLAPNTV